MLPYTTENQTNTYHLQKDVKNKLDRLIKSGHLERLETIGDDCFVSPVIITVKKDKTVKLALDARKRNDNCVKKKTAHAKYGRITKPNIHRVINKQPRPNLDIRDKPQLCLRPSEISTRN